MNLVSVKRKTKVACVLLILSVFELLQTEAASICPGGMYYDSLTSMCICARDMYYDKVIKRCSDCYNICHHAKLQNTENDCTSFCPNYQLPLNDIPVSLVARTTCQGDMVYDDLNSRCVCPKDMFYDDVTRHCSSCYDICFNAFQQRTVGACDSSCPGYQLPSISTKSALPSSGQASTVDVHKITVIAAVSIPVTILLIVLAISICCCRSTLQKIGQQIMSRLPCVQRERNGKEPEHDKTNKCVQLAPSNTSRSSEIFDICQPDDAEKGLLSPSGGQTADEGVNEETTVKV